MNAIVPYRAGRIERGEHRGSHRIAHLDSGGLALDVRVERVDKRNRCIWYALNLGSRDVDVTGRLIAVRGRNATEEVGSIVVAAGSMGSARFAVTTPRRGSYRSMYLEISSSEMMLRVDAPRPPTPSRLGPLRVAGAIVLTGLVLGGAAALPLALGHDATLSVPARAVAGTRVHLPYASTGVGSASYLALADDGTTLAEARLASAGGEITFALPARLAGHRVTVTLATRAPWNTASRSASFLVTRPQMPVAAPVVARVLSFSARRDATQAGETVLASYLAVADRGTVQLIDEAGTIVRSVPMGRVGTTRVAVPAAYRTVPLVTQLTVHRGGTRAVASVAVAPVVPDPAAATADEAAAPADATPGEAITPIDSSSLQSGGMVSLVGRAIAGHPLKLRIVPQASPMHLELEDEGGTSIAVRDVAPASTYAELALPPSSTRATYLLAIHYTRDGGEETVIRTVVAAPK